MQDIPGNGILQSMPCWTARDENYLVFDCQSLQGLRDKYPDPFEDFAVTVVKVMW